MRNILEREELRCAEREREREVLNILVLKIYLENNSNTSCVVSTSQKKKCVVSTVANIFYFLHFGEVIGADFCEFLERDMALNCLLGMLKWLLQPLYCRPNELVMISKCWYLFKV